MNSCTEVPDSSLSDLGSEGGDGGGGDMWETCYWLVYYDEYGGIADVVDLGCYDYRAE
jgi:hypothetical protein